MKLPSAGMQTVTIWVTLPWQRAPRTWTCQVWISTNSAVRERVRGPLGCGNWRVTFSCAERDMVRVDYEDYH